MLTTNIFDTHFLVKDWPHGQMFGVYVYRAWGSVGSNPDHHFYVSNDLTSLSRLSTFQIGDDSDITDGGGFAYCGFHDVVLIAGTLLCLGEFAHVRGVSHPTDPSFGSRST